MNLFPLLPSIHADIFQHLLRTFSSLCLRIQFRKPLLKTYQTCRPEMEISYFTFSPVLQFLTPSFIPSFASDNLLWSLLPFCHHSREIVVAHQLSSLLAPSHLPYSSSSTFHHVSSQYLGAAGTRSFSSLMNWSQRHFLLNNTKISQYSKNQKGNRTPIHRDKASE